MIEVGDYVIINQYDKPCTRLVARVKAINGDKVVGEYITAETSTVRCTGRLNRATAVGVMNGIGWLGGGACGVGDQRSRACLRDERVLERELPGLSVRWVVDGCRYLGLQGRADDETLRSHGELTSISQLKIAQKFAGRFCVERPKKTRQKSGKILVDLALHIFC